MVKLVVEDALRKQDRVSWAVRTFLVELLWVSSCMATSSMAFLFVLGVVKTFESLAQILSFNLRCSENLWFLDRFAVLC